MAKAVSGNSQVNVPFSLIHTPIDYFSLETSYFPTPFQTTKNLYNLKAGEYFSLKKHHANFDYDKKETVVLNFQVGQGKTTLCYDLIAQYEKKGYCVIVCSPFIKLVNKDYQEIKARVDIKSTSGLVKGVIPKVFKYDDVNALSHWGVAMKDVAPHSRSVHVMTINCLLGNSGNDSFEQAFSKQDYLKELLKVVKNKGQKVALFIDEIHESINNFSSILIPQLLRWNGLVNKIFIASATYTPATIPIIKTLSLLTDRNIKIYETKRVKNKTVADIHLHICNVPTYPQFQFEKIVKDQIAVFQSNGKNVNIITGTKNIAENISGSKDIFSKVNKTAKGVLNFSVNEINLLTGDTEAEYQKGQNNIGTTFKTGVNIDGNNDVLFVIFPNLSKNATIDYYGTFYDGLTSIIQSIGRLRKGSEIHLFINDPDNLIGNKQDYPKAFQDKNFLNHLPTNRLYDEVIDNYQSTVKNISKEILEMENGLTNPSKNPVEAQKKQFGLWYPNENVFLQNNSQIFALKHDNFSFGRQLSPYIFWSCINNQFINGTLKSITHYTKPVINLSVGNTSNIFNGILIQHSVALKNDGFRKGIGSIGKYLSEGFDGNGNPEKIDYKLNGKSITTGEIISRKPAFLYEIGKLTFDICTGSKFPETKAEYINACVNEAQRSTVATNLAITKAYFELGILKKDFITTVKSVIIKFGGNEYIPNENTSLLNAVFISRATTIIEVMKEHDLLLKYKAISFMQDGAINGKRLYTLFAELFLKLGNKKQIGKKQYIEVLEFDPMASISIPGLL